MGFRNSTSASPEPSSERWKFTLKSSCPSSNSFSWLHCQSSKRWRHADDACIGAQLRLHASQRYETWTFDIQIERLWRFRPKLQLHNPAETPRYVAESQGCFSMPALGSDCEQKHTSSFDGKQRDVTWGIHLMASEKHVRVTHDKSCARCNNQQCPCGSSDSPSFRHVRSDVWDDWLSHLRPCPSTTKRKSDECHFWPQHRSEQG